MNTGIDVRGSTFVLPNNTNRLILMQLTLLLIFYVQHILQHVLQNILLRFSTCGPAMPNGDATALAQCSENVSARCVFADKYA